VQGGVCESRGGEYGGDGAKGDNFVMEVAKVPGALELVLVSPELPLVVERVLNNLVNNSGTGRGSCRGGGSGRSGRHLFSRGNKKKKKKKKKGKNVSTGPI